MEDYDNTKIFRLDNYEEYDEKGRHYFFEFHQFPAFEGVYDQYYI